MAEYIEREALMRNLKHFAPEQLTPLIESLIQKQPAADVVEVRRGEWIKKPHISKEYKQCNVCKYDFSRLIPDNFCPNCGAKMDGKDGTDYA